MWTPTSGAQHSREYLRYGSDLTDGEWAIVAPLLPMPARTGRPWRWSIREVMNAIFYVLRSGCPWRMVPDCFPPATTVYRWFVRLREDSVFEAMNHHLLMRDRAPRTRSEPVGGGDRQHQSIKTAEAGGPRGYDAAKKVWGRKRHAMVDTDGRALMLKAHPASIQDRDGAVPLLKASRKLFPFVERAFADGVYAATRVAQATTIAVEIVRKHPDQIGYALHPHRWVVERFFAWIGRNRRLAKDFEASIASAEAFL
jgi:putative transposase